jgi:hypothetical protein
VHYPGLVRVLDGARDLQEQLQPAPQAQSPTLAVTIDALAVDALHHQIRSMLLVFAAIDQPRDARMAQPS